MHVNDWKARLSHVRAGHNQRGSRRIVFEEQSIHRSGLHGDTIFHLGCRSRLPTDHGWVSSHQNRQKNTGYRSHMRLIGKCPRSDFFEQCRFAGWRVADQQQDQGRADDRDQARADKNGGKGVTLRDPADQVSAADG